MSAPEEVVVNFDVSNAGARAGAETAQVYVQLPTGADEPPRRLVGWKKLMLLPSEADHVQLTIDTRMLAIFDVAANNWHVLPGQYVFFAGACSRDLRLTATSNLREQRVRP